MYGVDKLQLTLGLPSVVDGIEIKPLKLREIASITMDRYDKLKSMLCLEIEDIDDDQRELLKISDNGDICIYDIMMFYCSVDQSYRDDLEQAFKIFISDDISYNKGAFWTDKYKRAITRDIFPTIQNVVMAQNYIIRKERIAYGNKRARELAEKQERIRKRIEASIKKPDVCDIINAVKCSGKVIDIANMTMYELFMAFEQIDKEKDNSNKMLGVYTGNVDSKKLSRQDLSWIKVSDK